MTVVARVGKIGDGTITPVLIGLVFDGFFWCLLMGRGKYGTSQHLLP